MDQVTKEEKQKAKTFLLLRTKKKKKMCRAYKNWYNVFPGSGRGVYLKKKKKQTNKPNKGQKDRRANNINSRFIKYW